MDKYLIPIAIILLCGETGWLLADLDIVHVPSLSSSLNGDSDQNGRPSLGVMAQKRKEVRRRPHGDIIWEDTHLHQNLYPYDSVLTLDRSSAEIKLRNQSLIDLQENTLVTLEPGSQRTADQVRLHFRQGRFAARTTTRSQDVVAGDLIVQAAPHSQMAVQSDRDGKVVVEAFSGKAQVFVPGSRMPAQTLTEGSRLTIDGSKSVKSEALTTSWVTPADDQRVYTRTDKANLSVSWKGPADHIQVTPVNEHGEPGPAIAPLAVDGSLANAQLELPLGTYRLALQQGVETSLSRSVSIWKAPAIYLIRPLIRERFAAGASIPLVWTESSEVNRFRWELSSDPDFQTILQSGKTLSQGAKLDGLMVGHYFWRVSGEDGDGYEIPSSYFSDFFIVKKPLAAPKLRAPKLRRIIPARHPKQVQQIRAPSKANGLVNFINKLLGEIFVTPAQAADTNDDTLDTDTDNTAHSALFSWDPVDEAKGYVIEISKQPDFREPLVSQRISKTEYEWRGFSIGKYYWRVAAFDDSGDQGLFSDVGYADLSELPADASPLAVTWAPPPTKQTQAPAPTPVPTPAPTPAPTPELPSRPGEDSPFALSAGPAFLMSNDLGPDFTAKTSGLQLLSFKFSVKPEKHSQVRFAGAYEQVTLKPTDPNAYPFQDTLKIQALRLSGLYQMERNGTFSLGLTLSHDALFLQRSGWEDLAAQTPWLGGVSADWRWLRIDHEAEIMATLSAGQIGAADVATSWTWLIEGTPLLDFTISPELEALDAFRLSDKASEWQVQMVLRFGLRFR